MVGLILLKFSKVFASDDAVCPRSPQIISRPCAWGMQSRRGWLDDGGGSSSSRCRSVLVLTGIELIFSIVARMGLCFGFVLKTVLKASSGVGAQGDVLRVQHLFCSQQDEGQRKQTGITYNSCFQKASLQILKKNRFHQRNCQVVSS